MKPIAVAALALGGFAVVFAGGVAALEFEAARHKSSKEVVLLDRQPSYIKQVSGAVAAPDFRATAKRALESAVSIETFARTVDFFNQSSMEPVAAGSGVIVDHDGYIITNNHVVRMGEQDGELADRVAVTLADGRSFEAKIVGADPKADLCVLKIDGVDVTPIEIGDSSQLEVGQWVLAVGNPLGFKNSVTQGIVSSLGRSLMGDGSRVFVDGIQTDAPINSGNSGGPLVDQDGRLVGINSSIAVASPYSSGNIGIGFAIPVNRVKQVFQDIKKYGRARYGVIGMATLRSSSVLSIEDNRSYIRRVVHAEPPTTGALVGQVTQGGPADLAGVRPLDVVLAIDGQTVKDINDYLSALGDKRPGDKLQLKLWSAGATKTVTVVLTESQS